MSKVFNDEPVKFFAFSCLNSVHSGDHSEFSIIKILNVC